MGPCGESLHVFPTLVSEHLVVGGGSSEKPGIRIGKPRPGRLDVLGPSIGPRRLSPFRPIGSGLFLRKTNPSSRVVGCRQSRPSVKTPFTAGTSRGPGSLNPRFTEQRPPLAPWTLHPSGGRSISLGWPGEPGTPKGWCRPENGESLRAFEKTLETAAGAGDFTGSSARASGEDRIFRQALSASYGTSSSIITQSTLLDGDMVPRRRPGGRGAAPEAQ
jgi:hypothetical protein